MTDILQQDTYLDTFDTRGDLYNEATLIGPHARDTERRILIDLLRMGPHHVVVDAPAGGGFLAEGLRGLVDHDSQVICVEPSSKFSEAIDAAFVKHISPLDALPLGNGSVDRIGSLAGLHHLGDKSAFFHEAHRVLKPGGLFAVGDVLDETPVALFLNGPVDRFTTTGHLGLFLRAGEAATLLTSARFRNVREEHLKCEWTFGSVNQMVRYCQRLFGLVKASERQVLDAVTSCFDVEELREGVRLPWSLVYAVGHKGR